MRALSESSGPDLGRLSWVIWVTFKTIGAGGDFVHHIAAATRINTATAIAIEGHRTRGLRVGRSTANRHFPGSCIALQAPEVSAQLGGALVTDVAIFLQRLIYDSFQLRRHFRIEPERRGRIFVENGIKDRGAGVSTKRKRTGGGLV